jgi:hypothetical protein
LLLSWKGLERGILLWWSSISFKCLKVKCRGKYLDLCRMKWTLWFVPQVT